jgi:hypothetical protein
MDKNRARVVIRRKKSIYSKFMQSDYEANPMMRFVALNVRKEEKDYKNVIVFEVEQSNEKSHRDLKMFKFGLIVSMKQKISTTQYLSDISI